MINKNKKKKDKKNLRISFNNFNEYEMKWNKFIDFDSFVLIFMYLVLKIMKNKNMNM